MTQQRTRGLLALCSSVAFERAAFYGLQGILALYLADRLDDEGMQASIWLLPAIATMTGTDGLALVGIITGAFVSAAALAPALGGILADRLMGIHRAILVGGGMMGVGHGLLLLDYVLLPALGLIAFGSGLFKGPAAARLSGLYTQDAPQRVEGFRLFYLAINIAGLAGPLLTGTLGERVSWHAAFAVSCALMLAGLCIYHHRFAGRPEAPTERLPTQDSGIRHTNLAGLALLWWSVAFLTIPNAQLTNAYLTWVSRDFERSLGGWEFPASWIIAADGLLGLLALAGSGLFWRMFERRFGSLPPSAKATAGAVFVSIGAGLLVLASAVHEDARVPVAWGLGFQLCNSLGLANVLPAAMAIFGQSSTRHNIATAMAGFYLSLFAGGLASTWLASLFPSLPITTFWLLHAACALCGTVGLAIYGPDRDRRHSAKA